MRLIIGLGNPGPKYENTRHNAGFMALDRLAALKGFETPVKFGRNLTAKGRLASRPTILAWPQTFMNLSGLGVGEVVSFFKIAAEDILVLHDELDLEPGRLKLIRGGGSAGHNGLASIMERLGPDFCRLKIGIGRPSRALYVDGQADYVLSPFPSHEKTVLDQALAAAAEAAISWAVEGLTKTQNRINRRSHEKTD